MNNSTLTETIELKEIYKEYKKDIKMFEKQFILLNHYMNKASWPYTVNDYIQDCKEQFNINPLKLIKIIDCDKTKLDELEEGFVRDLSFFVKNINESLRNAIACKNNPLAISSISITKNKNQSILSITRVDNKSFEFVIPSQEQFKKILDYLNQNYRGNNFE